MTLLERLKALFTRDEIPDEAKLIFDKAKTPSDLLRGLDNLLTRNEVEARELNDEITKIEKQTSDVEEEIRAGALPERQKRNSLLLVKRLRKTMDNYEGRLRIYERNMTLHLNLIGKIQQMEAMKLRGVDEARMDQIVMDFEESLEKYADVMSAADAHEGRTATVSAREDRELRDLESEIVRKGAGKDKEKDAPAGLPAGLEPSRPPEPERERPHRRPIEEVVERALGGADAAKEPSARPGETNKRREIE